MHNHHRGFGKIELIVGITCIIIVLVVAVLVLRAGRADSIWHEGDAVKMRGIHQSMLVHAGEFDGLLPRPGLIARDGDVPGRGEEDHRHNNTAAMYAFMVAHNYLGPQQLVSDAEPNSNVHVFEIDDLWEGGDAATPWPRTFQADLTRMSHVSYAHMFMFGERFDRHWRETADSTIPVISNRGPAEGVRERESYTTDGNGRWSGYVVAGDHSSQLQTSMTPNWLTYGEDDNRKPDNLFALDDGLHGVDVVLTYTRGRTASGAELHHD